eukprot:CAMPEP_0202685776 /NCGR_PEP_ID=MMETSP1385-20130828/1612_1 /ASSEMBLY_ACC=CAM_ASM_000861 /TAXON_ID=933848 /ORGANISM="Elphidium margaritaceum" /LENGTH=949 /DNA_ID=CAMNT_0049340211 /DNA_START=108 /DNA_END=2957 /DNA_ORIENTATION=+
MAEEDATYGDTAQTGGDETGNEDYKSEMSESDLIKLGLLQGLIKKNVNLSDFELAELTGFGVDKIGEIRKKAKLRTQSNAQAPFSFDYVLAFDVGDKEKKHKASRKDKKNMPDDASDPEWTDGMPQDKYYGQIFNNFWQRLEAAKLSVEAYRAKDKTMMFLVVGITEANLELWADERDADLLIDPVGGVAVGRERGFALAKRTKLNAGDSSATQAANDDLTETLDVSNWNFMYGEFSRQADPKVYKHYDRIPGNSDVQTVFDEKTRLRIIYESIIADSNEGGAEIKIEDCLLNKGHPLTAVFPLHDQERLQHFNDDWIKSWTPSKLLWCPLEELRDYFGEPVGFYFAFLQFYMRWLISPTIVGIIFFVWQTIEGKFAVVGIPLLCFFIIFWCVAFVDFWLRAEARYRMQWGMTKFQQKAVARPQFNGDWTHDAVTGLWVEQFSFFKRACRVSTIYTFVVVWLSGCVAAVVAVLLTRDNDPNNLLLKVGMGVVNGVMIFVFDAIYKAVSTYGNEWENHRTEEDYQNALVAKAFCFKFINSFASLFYLAFVRPTQKGTWYYVRFYDVVCGTSSEYMSQFLALDNWDKDSTADDAIGWFNENFAALQDDEARGSDYDVCIDMTAEEADRHSACVSFVHDEDKNIGWSVVVQGYVPTDGNCPDDALADGRCPGACTVDDTDLDFNEAVLQEVNIQLLTLFLTAIFIQNTLEVGLPLLFEWIKDRAKRKKQAEANDGEFFDETEAEDQATKGAYANTIDDMSELVVQYGYVTLFCMAFPLTPLLALLNNIVEMKVDGTNLVKSLQRPHPNGSVGLGSWNSILAVLSIIAIGTNVALITWRSKVVTLLINEDEQPGAKWIFCSILMVILGILVFIEKWIIPDVPLEVEQAIERQRLIEAVLILGAGPDNDGDEPPNEDSDGGIQFDPALEFIDVETLPDIPLNNVRYRGQDPVNP